VHPVRRPLAAILPALLASAFAGVAAPARAGLVDALEPKVAAYENHRERLRALGLLEKVRFEMWPGDIFRYSALKEPLPEAGIYEISYTLSGLKPEKGRAPRLKVYEEKLDRVLFEQDIVAPEDQPVTVTFRAHLQKGTGANPKVNPAGKLPDGRTYETAEDFKKLLLADLDTFNHTFIEKLATYGLRRSMTFADRDALKAIAAAGKAKDYRVRDIVDAFVCSELFQKR
jgi:hypothetical protein